MDEYKTTADLSAIYFLRTTSHSSQLVCLDGEEEDYADFFSIKIGNEVLDAFIVKDDLYIRSLIRTAIEYFFEYSECKFFFFRSDVSPVFHVESEGCLLEIRGNQYIFGEPMVKLTVYDDEDILLNPRVFYCEPKEFFRVIYMGLLEISKNNYSKYPVCYNNLKSPVIEDYLQDINYEEDEIQIRQKIINGILIVQKNGLFFCESHKDDQWFLTEDDLFPEIKDSSGGVILKPFLANGFSEWFNKSKDVEKGYQFANKIKENLREDIDLWWEIGNTPVLITGKNKTNFGISTIQLLVE